MNRLPIVNSTVGTFSSVMLNCIGTAKAQIVFRVSHSSSRQYRARFEHARTTVRKIGLVSRIHRCGLFSGPHFLALSTVGLRDCLGSEN
jgi:hypothetical protein